jgi:hypothetical protein
MIPERPWNPFERTEEMKAFHDELAMQTPGVMELPHMPLLSSPEKKRIRSKSDGAVDRETSERLINQLKEEFVRSLPRQDIATLIGSPSPPSVAGAIDIPASTRAKFGEQTSRSPDPEVEFMAKLKTVMDRARKKPPPESQAGPPNEVKVLGKMHHIVTDMPADYRMVRLMGYKMPPDRGLGKW